MRKDFEISHIFHLGAGAKRGKRGGIGCDCEANLLTLTPYEHDCLDLRTINNEVEHYKTKHKKWLATFPKNYRHRKAWAIIFCHVKEVNRAVRHHEYRNRGLTSCTKL